MTTHVSLRAENLPLTAIFGMLSTRAKNRVIALLSYDLPLCVDHETRIRKIEALTVASLIKHSELELREQPGTGKTTVDELKSVVARLGLSFAQPKPLPLKIDFNTDAVDIDKQFLKTKEAADFLNLAETTLEKWRWSGHGPRFVKMGRSVRYSKKDLIFWATSLQSRNS
jgi:predicted DNA-binding transcriptional regulator AlpA